MALRDVTFDHYTDGSTVDRCFLHYAPWPAGETRRLTKEEAAELQQKFPGCFTATVYKRPQDGDEPDPEEAETDAPAADETTTPPEEPADPAAPQGAGE